MKWLKFTCPFGGKKYPLIIAGIILIALPVTLLNVTESERVPEYTLLAVFAALIGCWYFEQRLTAEEREICDGTMSPLWEPVPEDVLAQLSEQTQHISREVVTVMTISGAFAFGFRFPKRGEPNMTGMSICIIILLAAFGLDLVRRLLWKTVDSTAVCTVIPIDHMYDVTHHSKRSTWEVSYLVFYQPEGRYVLRAKGGSGDADRIAVVKYHGMVTWVPYPQPVQSHNGFYL